jgi:multidrug resistance protein, MATE family
MSKVDGELTDPLFEKEEEVKTDREAAWDVWALAKNITIGTFFHPVFTVVNAAVLGRISTNELAGFGLGSLTTGIMCLAIGMNFNGGFSTFCGQAFGSKDHRLCKIYMNRQLFLIMILYVIIAIPMLFIEQIWTAIGQDPEVIKYAVFYVRIVFPSFFFYFISQTLAAYANQQRLPQYSRNSTILGAFLHATFVAILVGYFHMGFQGVCYATAGMFFVRFTSNFLQVKYSKDIPPQNDVYFFSRETVSNLWPLLSLNLKSMMMGIWGWWAFDIFTLIASYMSKDEVAAQTVMRSLGLMTFMIPVGFALASGTCVSNAVGAGKIRLAKQYCKISIRLTTSVSLMQILFLIIFRDSVISIFTNLDEIKALMILTWPTLMVFCFFDTTQ